VRAGVALTKEKAKVAAAASEVRRACVRACVRAYGTICVLRHGEARKRARRSNIAAATAIRSSPGFDSRFAIRIRQLGLSLKLDAWPHSDGRDRVLEIRTHSISAVVIILLRQVRISVMTRDPRLQLRASRARCHQLPETDRRFEMWCRKCRYK